MKTIYLILSLLIGGYSLPTSSNLIPTSTTISYKVVPPAEKKKRKTTQRKKAKTKKRRHINKEQANKKSRLFFILSGVFTALWIGLVLATYAILLGGGGWGALSIAVAVALLAIVSFVWSILFLIFGAKSLKKSHKSTLKKEEATLKKEVRNLSKREQQYYVKINDALTAARIKKSNLDRTAQQKIREGMTRLELKEAFDQINDNIRRLESEIRDLQIKSRRARF